VRVDRGCNLGGMMAIEWPGARVGYSVLGQLRRCAIAEVQLLTLCLLP
jgi:hypothetical protein